MNEIPPPVRRSPSSFDVAVMGAGFAGSIIAGILASRGMRVVLIDAGHHPRMAIGESSTPMADLILAKLGKAYQWPTLTSLSRWGTWQRDCPELDGGIKRGFSYFNHQPLASDQRLIIEASQGKENSDTHWFRKDVDHRLFLDAIDRNVVAREGTRVVQIHRRSNSTRLDLEIQNDQDVKDRLACDWLIDATGNQSVAASLLGWPNRLSKMNSHTSCQYAHLTGVGSWSANWLARHGASGAPFDSDAAAQHHVLGQEGWAWVLRMKSGIASVGLVSRKVNRAIDPFQFPDFANLIGHENLQDARWKSIPRIQQRKGTIAEQRVIALPTAVATIDPLHSTGIAHALSGVERVASMILDQTLDCSQYVHCVETEIDWIDQHVSAAYRVMPNFELFSMATMVFITAAIYGEEARLRGDDQGYLYGCDHPPLRSACQKALEWIESPEPIETIRKKVIDVLSPWNVANLFHSSDGCYPYKAGGKA